MDLREIDGQIVDIVQAVIGKATVSIVFIPLYRGMIFLILKYEAENCTDPQ
jgi:hypothetical protein